MQHWYLIPLAAMAGLIAGSWGSRADLAAYKENQETEKARQVQSRRSGGFGAIADLANVPSRASHPRRVKVSDTAAAVETNAVAAAETPERDAAVRTETKTRRVAPDDLRARIDEAAELWRTRAELAKTQWKTKLELSETAAASFDEALANMNDALRETMVAAAEEIAQSGKLTPELGVKLMQSMTTSLGETYETIGKVVDADRRGDVAEMTLHDFIDPSVIEPLVSVQGMLGDGAPGMFP